MHASLQPQPPADGLQWWSAIPWYLKDLVVPPVLFHTDTEYEVQAARTLGKDLWDEPCYCAFRYIQRPMQLKEPAADAASPVFAQNIDAWRLVDGHWLVLTRTYADFDTGSFDQDLTIQSGMPR